MDPEVILGPPQSPRPSEVSQPCQTPWRTYIRNGGVQKDTGPSFYITSWLSLLLFLSALPCFRTGKGKTENRRPRSCRVPHDKKSFLNKESFFVWISSWFWAWGIPQWPRPTVAQSPMLNIVRHCLKGVQIIIMLKTHILNLCMHPQKQWREETKTMENPTKKRKKSSPSAPPYCGGVF